MYTYAKASEQYAAGRKYAPIGTKITNNLWLNCEEDTDRFTVSYVYSKYYTGVDELGATTHHRAGPSERDKYTMRAVAHIYKDHVRLIADPSSGGIARNFFMDVYNCTYRKAPSIKIKGMEWTFFAPGTAYYDKYHGNGDLLHSSGDVLVFPDGTFRPEGQPLVRVHDKDRRAVLNERIKAVRRMLALRAKLGGFSGVDWPKLNAECQSIYRTLTHYPRALIRSQPQVVDSMLMAVDPENFESMLPLLWLSKAFQHGYYGHPDWDNISSSYDWLHSFNAMIEAAREGLRTVNKTVSYVEHKSQKEGEEDAVC
jgi:hypothetical protein